MIKTIAHLADLHFSNKFSEHEKFNYIIEQTYNSLLITKPDLIVIVGDIFHDFIDQENETTMLVGKFLTKLSTICNIVMCKGNHDIRKIHTQRINSIQLLVNLMNNDRLTYYDKTGVYNYDENLTFYVWDYADKLNPYTISTHLDTSNRISIDLYHNPINNCNMITKIANDKHYKNLGEFKCDYLMLGDIHLFQYLDKEKRKAYCGSLFQTNFGEYVDNHGYILWNLENKTSKFIDVENDYNYITFETKTDFNYDDITFNSVKSTIKSQYRVIWNDYYSTNTKENEKKIRDYFKDNYHAYVKIEKDFIKVNLIDTINENITNINIFDKEVQTNIFKEYLEVNEYDSDLIKEIFKIDDIISNRIDNIEIDNNITWTIDKLTIDNFKSYGDNNILDWSNKNGIIQLNGINKQGKTTLLDAICYVLYGKTLATQTKEKFGDLRYINNKRDLNYCKVSCILNANGEYYTLVRKTEIDYKKNGSIKTVSTNLDYYEGSEIKEEKKLTDERLKLTQNKIDKIIGTFNNFIRLAFTNADNLNDSLSEDRSVFIDSLLRDLSLDIFEKKLDEFTKYEKEQNLEKLNINKKDLETKISENTLTISEYNNTIQFYKNDIVNINKEIENKDIEKEKELKKLNNIDEDVLNTNKETLLEEINDIETEIESKNNLINITTNKISKIIVDDNIDTLLKDKNIELKKILINKSDIESDIKDFQKDITTYENKIKDINNEFELIKKDEIQKLKNTSNQNRLKINHINNNISGLKLNELNRLENIIKDYDNDIKNINNEITSLKKEAKKKKDEITEIENSSICSECKRPYENENDTEEQKKEHKLVLQNNIAIKNKDIEDIFAKYKLLSLDINKINLKKEDIQDNIDKLNNEDYTYSDDFNNNLIKFNNNIKSYKDDNIKIKNNIDNILKNTFTDCEILLTLQIKNDKLIDSYNQKIEDKNLIINKLNITSYDEDIADIEKEIKVLEDKQNLIKDKQKLETDKSKYLLDISDSKIELLSKKSLYDKIILSAKFILENEIINDNIFIINNEINILKDNIKDIQDKIDKIILDVNELEIENKNNNNLIVKFDKLQKIENIYKTYKSLVHRDGIPSYLLKKNLNLINYQLEKMLEEVDFILYFNDNIELKMSNKNRLDVSQNAVESSGAERTFCSLALKMSLHEVNKTSKPNFILLDEIMGKLIENSISEFKQFLYLIRNKIDKIFIIEHVNNIDYDYIITVKKDLDGISSFSFIN